MSAPETKALSPSPASTITCTSGSASSSAILPDRSRHICRLMALYLSGLDMIAMPTAPSRRTRISGTRKLLGIHLDGGLSTIPVSLHRVLVDDVVQARQYVRVQLNVR